MEKGINGCYCKKKVSKLNLTFKNEKKLVGTILSIFQDILDKKLNIKHENQNKIIQEFQKNKRVVVFIDDLDRGWEGKKENIKRISAMINAVRDLARENSSINFKISLRTDVYYLYRTNDESTDKVEGAVVWLKWKNFQILALLSKRIVTYFDGIVAEEQLLNSTQEILAKILDYVFDTNFNGKGKWAEIPVYRLLTSLIRMCPRDLIKICTLAAREARKNKKSKIGTNEFNSIFEEYSRGRLQDTIIEFRSELPDIERLLINMKPTTIERKTQSSYVFKTDQLLKSKEY